MASINQISIDLTFTGLDKIEQATKASRQFQREIRSLIREEKDGALTTAQFASRVGDLAGRLQKTTGNYAKAANAVFEYKNRVQEAIAQENAIREARAQAAANKALEKQYAQEAAELLKVQKASQQYINSITMLERANKSAEASAELFSQQLDRVDAANLKVAQSFGDAVRAANTYEAANKSAEASAEIFTRELAKQEQQAMETARAHQQALRALRETALANKSAETSAEAFSREMDRLQAKFNPLYAASQRYESALNELNRAKQLGVLNARQYDAALEDLNAQLAMGMTGMSGFGGAANASSRAINRSGVVMQQTGYQVGDFLVQVQSGTNAFVAFGQQATQLAGLLTLSMNPKLVALGAALSIIIPLTTAIAAGFMRTRDAASDAADGVDVLSERLQSARREISSMAFEVEALRRGFEDFQEFALVSSIETAQQRIIELQQQIYELEQLGAAAGPNERELAAAQENLRVLQEQLESYRQQRTEHDLLTTAEERRLATIEGIADASERIRTAYNFLRDSARAIGDEFKEGILEDTAAMQRKLDEAADEAARVAQESRELKEEMAEAKRQAELLAAIDLKSGISEAADEAARVARNLAAAQARIISMRQVGGGRGGDPRGTFGPNPARFDWEEPGALEQADLLLGLIAPDTPTSRGGASGPSPFEQAQEAINRLRASYDEQFAAAQRVAQAQEQVNEALRLGVIDGDMAIQIMRDYEASLQDVQNPMLDFAQNAARQMADAFVSIIDGSKSASDAFRDMARVILEQALRMAVINPIINSIFGGVGGFSPLPSFFANGAAFSGGRVVPFATGGVVTGPTTFPMAGRQTGLMGEAGPEAIMPLTRTKGGKLGVVAEGGGGDNITVENHFHIAANGDDSVKRIIAQEAPKIAALTQKQIVDQRRRGGAMKGTFG